MEGRVSLFHLCMETSRIEVQLPHGEGRGFGQIINSSILKLSAHENVK